MPGFRVGHPRCKLIQTADHTLAAGANAVPFDSAVYDDEAMWDGTTGVIVDRDGLWLVATYATRQATSTAGNYRMWQVVNGVNANNLDGGTTTLAQGLSIVDALELAAGDKIELWVQLHATASQHLLHLSVGLTVVRIGPKRWV